MLGWVGPCGVAPARTPKAEARELAPARSVIKPQLRLGFVFCVIALVKIPEPRLWALKGEVRRARLARRSLRNRAIGESECDRSKPPSTSEGAWHSTMSPVLAGKLPKDCPVWAWPGISKPAWP